MGNTSRSRSRPGGIAQIAAAAVIVTAFACARQEAPTGGTADRLPPIVLSVSPGAFTEVSDPDALIRIQFNERISERTTTGLLDDAVVVSPESGTPDVEHKRDALEVKLDGGLRSGVVYRVTVQPVVRDMFNNRLRDPFEFVFSTGGTLHPNAVVGMVIERVSGRPARDVLVQARPTAPGDTTVVYPARTDSSGSYALRYLPPGRYTLVGFQDNNRNRSPDLMELQARRDTLVGSADTVFLNFAALEGDTTPARLTRAEVVGPSLIRLRFDEYLDPDASLATVGTLLARADSQPGTIQVRQVLHEHRFLALRAAAVAPPATGDTVVPPPADARVPRPAGPSNYVGRAPQTDSANAALLGLTLPSQVLYAELVDTLPFLVEYKLRIQGVTNLSGLLSGTDSVEVTRDQVPMPVPPRPGPGPRP